MTSRQLLKALKRAAKDPEYDLDCGDIMVQVVVDGDPRWYTIREVSEGGATPLFPTLIAGDCVTG